MSPIEKRMTELKGSPPIEGDYFLGQDPDLHLLVVQPGRGWWVSQKEIDRGDIFSRNGWSTSHKYPSTVVEYTGNIYKASWED